jgi:diguanylate cyclase (GGDEF)-like protein
MPVALHAFTLPLIISALICLAVALLILQRRNVKGGPALAVLMLELACWAGAEAVMSSLSTLPAQVFWLKLAHGVLIAAPLTFLVFVAQLTDSHRWLARTSLLLLAIEPVIAFFVIWTNPVHFPFYSFFQSVPVNDFLELGWGRGPWFWLNAAYAYLLGLVAIVMLLRAFMRAGTYIRVQFATVLIGCLLLAAVNAYVLLSPNASRNLDLTPLSAAASGLIFAYALFRQRLLDVVPVARSMLFEKLRDGVLVLDSNDRILDANVAAQQIIQIGKFAYGRHIWEVFPQWRTFVEASGAGDPEMHFELPGRIDPARFFDVSVVPLRDSRGRQNGRLISFRDITERKRAEMELHKMNSRLQRQVRKISALHDELQEQAIRDPLTGLYNRRYLDETLEREFSRARRGDYPISVILMDIDQFKRVNDTYGHKAGDRVLKSLGEIVHLHIRAGDFACRFGGEEFVIVMPETAIETAAARADEIRKRFYAARFFKADHAVVPSLSIGVAAFPAHGKTAGVVLNAADHAMYAAKSSGGNKSARFDGRKKLAARGPAKKAAR